MGNNRILCKLDRMLCNQAWSNLFPRWKYKVMARVVKDNWDQPLDGDPLFQIGSKLRCLKSWLKEWNTMVFGQNKQHILEYFARVEALQLHLDSEIDNEDAARKLTKANQLQTSAVNYDKEH
ncbi:hypothetical protein GIB67_013252 [Kingdonia uniflora]|uniref:Uncharacterized protein n=1 Tax=Kingdonia uniflora TaxID=39325 RepID=A0A7J7LN10_9MAGN|nr:hypothetical protein GIB67_013252 [Kingdonia uniflora]